MASLKQWSKALGLSFLLYASGCGVKDQLDSRFRTQPVQEQVSQPQSPPDAGTQPSNENEGINKPVEKKEEDKGFFIKAKSGSKELEIEVRNNEVGSLTYIPGTFEFTLERDGQSFLLVTPTPDGNNYHSFGAGLVEGRKIPKTYNLEKFGDYYLTVWYKDGTMDVLELKLRAEGSFKDIAWKETQAALRKAGSKPGISAAPQEVLEQPFLEEEFNILINNKKPFTLNKNTAYSVGVPSFPYVFATDEGELINTVKVHYGRPHDGKLPCHPLNRTHFIDVQYVGSSTVSKAFKKEGCFILEFDTEKNGQGRIDRVYFEGTANEGSRSEQVTAYFVPVKNEEKELIKPQKGHEDLDDLVRDLH